MHTFNSRFKKELRPSSNRSRRRNRLTSVPLCLQDVSRTPVDWDNEQILTIITYLGCGVSSLFLGITILTYTAFE